MADLAALERECDVFARYLGASAGDPYVKAQYVAAHEAGVVELAGTNAFQRRVVSLASSAPWSLRALDVHSRVFANGGLLRRKLVLLLAILETRAPHDAELDTPTAGSHAGLFLRMAWIGLVFVVLLIASTIALAPVALLPRGGVEK